MFGENFKKQKIHTPEVEINTVWGGKGKPLLLLHGYPQTHVMWHAVAAYTRLEFSGRVP